jgi:uncharacterized protein YodC (DUF2158 family)
MDIKVGDVVKLKSGGPAMTVNAMLEKSNCDCRWFDDTQMQGQVAHAATFAMEALDKQDKQAEPAPAPHAMHKKS